MRRSCRTRPHTVFAARRGGRFRSWRRRLPGRHTSRRAVRSGVEARTGREFGNPSLVYLCQATRARRCKPTVVAFRQPLPLIDNQRVVSPLVEPCFLRPIKGSKCCVEAGEGICRDRPRSPTNSLPSRNQSSVALRWLIEEAPPARKKKPLLGRRKRSAGATNERRSTPFRHALKWRRDASVARKTLCCAASSHRAPTWTDIMPVTVLTSKCAPSHASLNGDDLLVFATAGRRAG